MNHEVKWLYVSQTIISILRVRILNKIPSFHLFFSCCLNVSNPTSVSIFTQIKFIALFSQSYSKILWVSTKSFSPISYSVIQGHIILLEKYNEIQTRSCYSITRVLWCCSVKAAILQIQSDMNTPVMQQLSIMCIMCGTFCLCHLLSVFSPL